ncbi:MAG: hypothetical protein ACOZCO_17535 [Bacteroidota bacterium]
MNKIATLFFLLVAGTITHAQTDSSKTTEPADSAHTILKVYISCDECDISFMKQELPYINYVRDRKLAQVQMITSTQETGSGGREYCLQFLGLKEFDQMNDTLRFSLLPNYSVDDFREKMNRYMLMGLTRYIAKTPHAEKWETSYLGETDNQEVKDKWNFWVFNISASGWFNGEQYYSSQFINTDVSAERITNENKIQTYFNNNYSKNVYRIDDTTSFTSLFKSYYAGGNWAHSINEKWSAGGGGDYASSLFNNLKFNASATVAIEYNIFPYSESTRRQFRFTYQAGPRYDVYFDTTVLGNTEKLWMFHQAGFYLKLVKQWGYISTNFRYMNFLNDFKLWSALVYSEASFNLFKGFSFTIGGNYSFIRNQVSLAQQEATESEILLRQKQVPTSSRYWFEAGISYTFGSIYNNIVNPRLD